MQSLFTDTRTTVGRTTVGLDSLPGDPCRINYASTSPGTTVSSRLNLLMSYPSPHRVGT
jgi:hypothetical protein